MKLNKFALLLAAMCALAPLATYPVITGVYALKNEKTGQQVIFFPDTHIDWLNRSNTKKQQADIVSYAQKLNAHIITEDMHQYAGSHSSVAKFIKKQIALDKGITDLFDEVDDEVSDASVGTDLMALASAHSVVSTNVEFRQTEDAFGRTDCDVELKELQSVIQATVDDIIKPLGHKGLDTYLNSIASTFNKVYTHETFATRAEADPLEAGTWLEKHTLPLLDGVLLRSIYGFNQKKQNVFVVAGADHIKNIVPVLQGASYKPVGAYGYSFKMPEDDEQSKNIVRRALDIGAFFRAITQPVVTASAVAVPGVTTPAVADNSVVATTHQALSGKKRKEQE